MGQWTNRLYENFRQPENQMVSSKRLATSLRNRRQLMKAQEELFSSNCNGAVASNEDDAIELMMYRQNGSRNDEAQMSEGPTEPLPDELGPAERGEAPPLREVETFSILNIKYRLWLLLAISWFFFLICRFLPSLVKITDSVTSR